MRKRPAGPPWRERSERGPAGREGCYWSADETGLTYTYDGLVFQIIGPEFAPPTYEAFKFAMQNVRGQWWRGHLHQTKGGRTAWKELPV